jgi:hypothetical protein
VVFVRLVTASGRWDYGMLPLVFFRFCISVSVTVMAIIIFKIYNSMVGNQSLHITFGLQEKLQSFRLERVGGIDGSI